MRDATLQKLAWASAAGAISLAFALISIRFWNASLDIPFEYYWDSLFFEAQIKGVLDHGTPFHNPDLGTPYGQDFVDFYQGGLTTYFAAWILGLFTNDWATVVNLLWLAGFPIVAVTSWWVMSSLGVPRLPALVAAVAFAILPYHFWRGEGHLILSGYFAIPLAGLLVLQVLKGEHLFSRPGTASESRFDPAAAIKVAVICLLIGLSAAYYPIFAIIVLGLAGLLAMFIPARRKAGSSGLLAALLIGFFLLLSLSPSILFRAENGSNPSAGVREAKESEYFGLSLSQMILPATNHRLQELAEVKQRFLSETLAPSEDSQSLGLLGTAGLAFCLIGLLLLPMGRPKWVQPLIPEAGLSILLAFLVGSIGGLAVVVAIFISPQVRAWNRISVFIAFFALVGLALVLGQLFSYLERRWASRAPAFLVSGALMVFALWDQTPARWPEQFRHDLIADEFTSDRELVSKMEFALPPGAQVFQIPYLKYPEGFPPPGEMDDFDPLRGYLHSTDLRWSYGAMKGRDADISSCVSHLPVTALVKVVDAWGFSALWIDTDGYSTADGKRVIQEAGSATRSEPIGDRAGRFKVFFLDSVSRLPQNTRRELRRSLPKDGSALQDCAPIQRAVEEAGL